MNAPATITRDPSGLGIWEVPERDGVEGLTIFRQRSGRYEVRHHSDSSIERFRKVGQLVHLLSLYGVTAEMAAAEGIGR